MSLAGGCGTAEYESRLEQTIEDLKLQNQFVKLRPAFAMNPQSTNLLVTLRVPIQFEDMLLLTEGSAVPGQANEVMPDSRLKPPPPLVGIPGYQVTLEQFGATSAGRRSMYFYLGVERIDPSTGGAAGMREAYLTALNSAIQGKPNAPINLAWKSKALPTPQPGVTKNVYELQVDIAQLFEVQGNQPSEIPGTFLLQAHEVLGHQVFLGWRIPKASLNYSTFLDAVRAAAGTISVAKAPPPKS